MAKKNNNEEVEVQVNNPELEGTQIQQQEQEQEQEQSPAAQVNNTVKQVKIHTLEEVDCYVGGNHYAFAKGKDVAVPSDVAAILTNAQKAYRN